jgi:cell division protein FtsB
MKFSEIILESRVDDFKNSFGKKYSSEQMDRIIDSIPQKFLSWVGKNFDSINFNENFPSLKSNLDRFQKISSNLPKTDLNDYASLSELAESIKDYDERVRRNFRKVEGGNVVYEDDRFFIVNPLTHESSCYYGKGTKWCTAADSDYQFKQYNQDGKLFYILDKTLPTNDPLYKVALLKKFDGDMTFYDAVDETLKGSRWINGSELFDKLLVAIDTYLESEYQEQLKIWRDKESARKERERLERLRQQRILNERREGAEERRMNSEWELGPDCPEEGLKAHALLKYLVENGDASIITNEDRNEILRLQNQIDELQVEYDNTEDERTDLSDEISNLEDEIEEIKDNKIDVYNIIPTGTHYDTTLFEVIDSEVEGNSYAVGTESEMESSSYESIENLIDDIGYEGFNAGFARQHIDVDSVASYAEETYDDDVRNNPDVYFDDSERQLSDEQSEKIGILQMRISQTNQLISDLEDQYDDEDSDLLDEKIEELTDLITEYEDEIQEIESSPEGEFPEDMISEKVEDLVSEVRSDPEWFMNEFGLDWSEYVDKDDFITAVIEADGYGHSMSSYDGDVDEIYVQDELFYVMRID